MNFSIGFWDLVWKIFAWLKISKAEQRAKNAEREVLNVKTEVDQQKDIDKVHTEHKEKQDEIQALKNATDICDRFNKL
jgi:hypothetical protein